MNARLSTNSFRQVLLSGCLAALTGLSISSPALAKSNTSDSGVPDSGIYVGLGGGYHSISFGTQDIYGYATSDVFKNGVQISSGSAGGPGVIEMGSQNTFAPTAKAGYFRHLPDSNWLWGAELSYGYLGSTSTVQNALLPQAGSTTPTGSTVSTPFTGNAVIHSYQTSIKDQAKFMPFVGRSFSRSFVYFGAGPTLSHVQTKLNGVIGFADVTGVPSDISGAPQSFSHANWVIGGAAMVGATYFFDPSWFLDVRYVYGMTSKPTVTYPATFTNPNGVNGTTITGSGYTTTSGRVITQGIGFTINKMF